MLAFLVKKSRGKTFRVHHPQESVSQWMHLKRDPGHVIGRDINVPCAAKSSRIVWLFFSPLRNFGILNAAYLNLLITVCAWTEPKVDSPIPLRLSSRVL